MPRATAARAETVKATLHSSAQGSHRTEQVARAAAGLFQEFGYQNVSIDRIGAAVGLTGPAVYRHFKGKHEILVHALMTQVRLAERLHSVANDQGTTAAERLQLLLAGFGDLTAIGNEATLWRREQRHLEPAEREVFRRYFTENEDRIAAQIIAMKPEIGEYDAELLGTVVLAMFSNTPDIRGTLSADRLQEIQTAVAWAVIQCPLPHGEPQPKPESASAYRQPAGRRERVIDAAARLFNERGFYNVHIDDIAKASEMSTATLYQHMASKTEVLRAVLIRGVEGLLYVTDDALAYASTPEQTLDALIETYIRQALGPNGRIMHILAADLLYLPEAEQQSLRNAQREYVAEWVEAIESLSDELSTADARALAQAAIGVVTDVMQNPRLRQRPMLAEELNALVRSMVLPPGLVPG
ncbi:TetR/AcrR family transcriptional regulator [Mycobacterium arosiense]|uniref:TetR family transcriptional regulator n=2 Tax=Mycobacterium avium complex (MAC) TaxID=120793 RepID=A0A1W9ZIS1_MYCAI|nr:TetR/AcrR family transcriptional regulator [Mycobacterium arosiense]ORA15718.1 TetR family transcriptional regulator [Mycobacterium arosiense ATCC BAA-1401 = DSM 45069]